MSHRLTVAAIGFLAVCITGCAGSKKFQDNMLLPPEDRYERALDLLEANKPGGALENLKKIDYFSAEDRRTLEPQVRLAIADSTFYQGGALSMIDARVLYKDYVTLYGDNPSAPYAQFQSAVCSLSQANEADRDQTQTFAALEDFLQVERRYPASPYAGAAVQMRVYAESTLAEHEFMVGRFYYKKKSYVAAVDRFRRILDLYPDYFEREKLFYNLGLSLVKANNPVEGRIYLDRLVQNYPESRYSHSAQRLLADLGESTDDLQARSAGAP